MALTKDGIVDKLVEKYGMQRREMIDFVDTFFDDIKSKLVAGERVSIAEFGTFYRKKQSYYRRRRTIKLAEGDEKWETITFRAAKLLQARIQRATIEESRDVD